MTSHLTEALLEMHFHHPLLQLFSTHFGASSLRLWKPSPQREVYVGFDQAWHRSVLSVEDFENEIRTAIRESAGITPTAFLAYFMQFKRVDQRQKRSPYTSPNISGRHLSVELGTKPNAETGISQHEALCRLSQVAGADVSYACPMVFDLDDIWEPTIDDLVIVCVDAHARSCAITWEPGSRHFIQFQDENAAAEWCSEPTEATVLSASTWIAKQEERTGQDVLKLMDTARKTLGIERRKTVPALSILQIGRGPDYEEKFSRLANE